MASPLFTVSTSTVPHASGTARLLAADTLMPGASSATGRPSTAEFMAKTGVDNETASSVLYGVIGSNKDYRDWDAIMASADPLADARASTAAMYTGNLPYAPADAHTATQNNILAQAGPFAFIQGSGTRPPALYLLDSHGNILRPAGYNPPDILRNIRDFGFDITQLADIAAQLDAKGIAYRPGELAPPSDLGADFADMATGGLGSPYDWRTDPLIASKGPYAAAQLARNQALAQELGIDSAATATKTAVTTVTTPATALSAGSITSAVSTAVQAPAVTTPNLGLPEWLAQTEDKYISKAVTFAAQSDLMNELRQRMQDLQVMDGRGFAQGVEQAYRGMLWEKLKS
jgi:hypothetical protein